MQRSTHNTQRSTLKENAERIRAREYEKDKRYDLEERLLRYAAAIVRFVERIANTRAGNHVGGQLLRCGTAVLPNHGEAQAAESPGDFLHKMRICLKELRESRRWLRLALEVPLIKDPSDADHLLNETEQLIKIFAASVRTTTARIRKSDLQS